MKKTGTFSPSKGIPSPSNKSETSERPYSSCSLPVQRILPESSSTRLLPKPPSSAKPSVNRTVVSGGNGKHRIRPNPDQLADHISSGESTVSCNGYQSDSSDLHQDFDDSTKPATESGYEDSRPRTISGETEKVGMKFSKNLYVVEQTTSSFENFVTAMERSTTNCEQKYKFNLLQNERLDTTQSAPISPRKKSNQGALPEKKYFSSISSNFYTKKEPYRECSNSDNSCFEEDVKRSGVIEDEASMSKKSCDALSSENLTRSHSQVRHTVNQLETISTNQKVWHWMFQKVIANSHDERPRLYTCVHCDELNSQKNSQETRKKRFRPIKNTKIALAEKMYKPLPQPKLKAKRKIPKTPLYSKGSTQGTQSSKQDLCATTTDFGNKSSFSHVEVKYESPPLYYYERSKSRNVSASVKINRSQQSQAKNRSLALVKNKNAYMTKHVSSQPMPFVIGQNPILHSYVNMDGEKTKQISSLKKTSSTAIYNINNPVEPSGVGMTQESRRSKYIPYHVSYHYISDDLRGNKKHGLREVMIHDESIPISEEAEEAIKNGFPVAKMYLNKFHEKLDQYKIYHRTQREKFRLNSKSKLSEIESKFLDLEESIFLEMNTTCKGDICKDIKKMPAYKFFLTYVDNMGYGNLSKLESLANKRISLMEGYKLARPLALAIPKSVSNIFKGYQSYPQYHSNLFDALDLPECARDKWMLDDVPVLENAEMDIDLHNQFFATRIKDSNLINTVLSNYLKGRVTNPRISQSKLLTPFDNYLGNLSMRGSSFSSTTNLSDGYPDTKSSQTQHQSGSSSDDSNARGIDSLHTMVGTKTLSLLTQSAMDATLIEAKQAIAEKKKKKKPCVQADVKCSVPPGEKYALLFGGDDEVYEKVMSDLRREELEEELQQRLEEEEKQRSHLANLEEVSRLSTEKTSFNLNGGCLVEDMVKNAACKDVLKSPRSLLEYGLDGSDTDEDKSEDFTDTHFSLVNNIEVNISKGENDRAISQQGVLLKEIARTESQASRTEKAISRHIARIQSSKPKKKRKHSSNKSADKTGKSSRSRPSSATSSYHNSVNSRKNTSLPNNAATEMPENGSPLLDQKLTSQEGMPPGSIGDKSESEATYSSRVPSVWNEGSSEVKYSIAGRIRRRPSSSQYKSKQPANTTVTSTRTKLKQNVGSISSKSVVGYYNRVKARLAANRKTPQYSRPVVDKKPFNKSQKPKDVFNPSQPEEQSLHSDSTITATEFSSWQSLVETASTVSTQTYVKPRSPVRRKIVNKQPPMLSNIQSQVMNIHWDETASCGTSSSTLEEDTMDGNLPSLSSPKSSFNKIEVHLLSSKESILEQQSELKVNNSVQVCPLVETKQITHTDSKMLSKVAFKVPNMWSVSEVDRGTSPCHLSTDVNHNGRIRAEYINIPDWPPENDNFESESCTRKLGKKKELTIVTPRKIKGRRLVHLESPRQRMESIINYFDSTVSEAKSKKQQFAYLDPLTNKKCYEKFENTASGSTTCRASAVDLAETKSMPVARRCISLNVIQNVWEADSQNKENTETLWCSKSADACNPIQKCRQCTSESLICFERKIRLQGTNHIFSHKLNSSITEESCLEKSDSNSLPSLHRGNDSPLRPNVSSFTALNSLKQKLPTTERKTHSPKLNIAEYSRNCKGKDSQSSSTNAHVRQSCQSGPALDAFEKQSRTDQCHLAANILLKSTEKLNRRIKPTPPVRNKLTKVHFPSDTKLSTSLPINFSSSNLPPTYAYEPNASRNDDNQIMSLPSIEKDPTSSCATDRKVKSDQTFYKDNVHRSSIIAKFRKEWGVVSTKAFEKPSDNDLETLRPSVYSIFSKRKRQTPIGSDWTYGYFANLSGNVPQVAYKMPTRPLRKDLRIQLKRKPDRPNSGSEHPISYRPSSKEFSKRPSQHVFTTNWKMQSTKKKMVELTCVVCSEKFTRSVEPASTLVNDPRYKMAQPEPFIDTLRDTSFSDKMKITCSSCLLQMYHGSRNVDLLRL